MSEWVQARTDLHTDPVVVRQARTLGMDAELVAFKWVRLWGWAREHSADGVIPGVDADDLDAVIGVPGFAAAAGKWLRWTGDGVEFVKFEKHNGNGARERFLNNERQRMSRKRHGDVTVKRDKNATAPLPEEKRREDIVNRENRACVREALPKTSERPDNCKSGEPEAIVWAAFDPVLKAMFPNGWMPERFIARLNDLACDLLPRTPPERRDSLLDALGVWLPTTKVDTPQGAIGLLKSEWARCLDSGKPPGVRTALAPIVSPPTQYTTAPVDQSKNIAAMEAAVNRSRR